MYDIVGAEDYNTSKSTNTSSIGVTATDDYTLEVKLNRRVNYFDQLMAFSVFFHQNQKVVESQGDKYGTTLDSVVYNGPFTLSNWKIEDQFTFSKNPTYRDANTVKLDNVNFKVVKDGDAAINLYETGEIGMVSLSSENVDKYKESPEFNSRQDSSTYFIMMDMKGKK